MPQLKRSMRTVVRWLPWPWLAISLVIAFGLGWPAAARSDDQGEEEASPVHISRAANGAVVLTLAPAIQERIALKVAEIESITFRPTVTAYGQLEVDPARTFTLRAPVAGVLRIAPGQRWPEIGSAVEPQSSLGYIEPRFTPSELVDLHARRMDALAEIDEIKADLEAVRASLENKSRLNIAGGLVSDRSLEETQARYRSGQARLEAARQKATLFESLIQGCGQSSALYPLQIVDSGEVVEVAARPGEVIDVNQVLIRSTRFDGLIAKVSLFAGQDMESPLPAAQIEIQGMDRQPLAGEPIGQASMASPLTGGPTLLYAIQSPAEAHLRPGAAVAAHIPIGGTPQDGVLIPRSAVVRLGGRAWVYAQTAEEQFERRDCELETPTARGWFSTRGVEPGERVVVEGAQMLLSEELKAQIANEAEAEE